MTQWGWMHIIETLANRDITKFDEVLDRNIYEVMTHLSYLRDYFEDQRKQIKQANR